MVVDVQRFSENIDNAANHAKPLKFAKKRAADAKKVSNRGKTPCDFARRRHYPGPRDLGLH